MPQVFQEIKVALAAQHCHASIGMRVTYYHHHNLLPRNGFSAEQRKRKISIFIGRSDSWRLGFPNPENAELTCSALVFHTPIHTEAQCTQMQGSLQCSTPSSGDGPSKQMDTSSSRMGHEPKSRASCRRWKQCTTRQVFLALAKCMESVSQNFDRTCLNNECDFISGYLILPFLFASVVKHVRLARTFQKIP